jgi:hypothetical protein
MVAVVCLKFMYSKAMFCFGILPLLGNKERGKGPLGTQKSNSSLMEDLLKTKQTPRKSFQIYISM